MYDLLHSTSARARPLASAFSTRRLEAAAVAAIENRRPGTSQSARTRRRAPARCFQPDFLSSVPLRIRFRIQKACLIGFADIAARRWIVVVVFTGSKEDGAKLADGLNPSESINLPIFPLVTMPVNGQAVMAQGKIAVMLMRQGCPFHPCWLGCFRIGSRVRSDISHYDQEATMTEQLYWVENTSQPDNQMIVWEFPVFCRTITAYKYENNKSDLVTAKRLFFKERSHANSHLLPQRMMWTFPLSRMR